MWMSQKEQIKMASYTIIVGVIGLVFLGYGTNWKIPVALFLLYWSYRCERFLDKL